MGHGTSGIYAGVVASKPITIRASGEDRIG